MKTQTGSNRDRQMQNHGEANTGRDGDRQI